MADSFTPEQIEQVRQFTELLSAATRETDPLIRAKQEEAKAADEARKRLKAFGDQLQDAGLRSIGTLAKGMTSTEQGLSKFSSSITGVTDTIGNFAGSLGFAGKMLGGFIKVMGEIAGASLKQNDDLMKSYQALSDMGSVTSGGLEGLAEQLHRVGLVASEAEKFEKALKPVTAQMAMFGGAVSAGRDKMVSVMEGLIGPNNQMEVALARLGYTTQDIREGAADFVQRQARLGLAQTKSTEQLQKESFKYMTTMKELQELTGMSRDEQQKAMDMQMADARMTIHLRGLKDDEARNLSQYLVLYEQRFGKEAAAGLKDRIVNDGKLTTELAAGSYQSATTAYADAIAAQKRGVGQFAESMNNTADGVRNKMDRFGKNIMLADNVMRDYGLNNELMNGALATNRETTDGVNKKLKELGDISGTGSERLNQNIVNEQKMRSMRVAADTALYEVGNLTVGMFTALIDIGYKFAKFLAKVVDKISPVVLGKKTNLSAQFRDMEDVEEEKKQARWKSRESKIEIAGARDDMGAAIGGKRDVLIKQMEDQERLVSKLKSRSEDEKISEGERAQAAIELKLAKKRYKQMDDEYAASRGFRDIKQVQMMREKRLNEALAEELKNKEEQDKLDDEEISLAKKTIAGFGTMKANTGLQVAGSQGMGTDAGGKQVSKEKMAQRQAAAGQLSEHGSKNAEEILKKISFKNKKENTGGGDVDPALYGLADKVNQLFPGSTFTAMNDVYHQVKKPNSRHTQGKALDFTPPNPPRSAEEADAMKEKLKDIGASKVLDEYFRDKSGGTGGHFHLEVARNGGLFKGPTNGYPVMLHGKNESVWNEGQMKSLIDDVKKSSINKYKEELMREFGIDTSSISKSKSIASSASLDEPVMSKIFEMMESKLDTLISRMETNNNLSDEILTYTKA